PFVQLSLTRWPLWSKVLVYSIVISAMFSTYSRGVIFFGGALLIGSPLLMKGRRIQVMIGSICSIFLLVGDTISKISSSQDRSVAYLFGDAGSATALEYSESESTMNWVLGTDGNGADFLKVDAGMFRNPL
ncbi:hypothetical protein N8766_06575, partial [bacterium]|nr:hypothetical protein [bacterium]